MLHEEEGELEHFKKLFGENLKKIRESQALSLLDADYQSKFDNSNISKYENGKREPRLSTILALAKMLQIHPKELLDFGVDYSRDAK